MKKDWLNEQVKIGRKSKIECMQCRKKWVAPRKNEIEKIVCGVCNEDNRRKEVV